MEELARIVLAILAIGILIAIVKHGPSGAPRWFKAKFLGRPS